MNWWLFIVPFAAAFSCWLVIKVFFIVLFHPRQARFFFGIKVQGILPAQQSTIASQLGRLAAENFLSAKVLEEKVTDPSHLIKVMPLIDQHIDDFLRNKLKKEMPLIGAFIGNKTIQSLKKIFSTELEALFPKIMSSFASNMVNDINIRQLVADKISNAPLGELEIAIQKNFATQIVKAQILAASIGLFIGGLAMLMIFCVK